MSTSSVDLHQMHKNNKYILSFGVAPKRITNTLHENNNHYICIDTMELKLQSQQSENCAEILICKRHTATCS